MDEASVKADFAKQVVEVVKLRDFMVEQRHSHHVPDNIVEEIEKARQVAMLGTTPSAEERAALARAYRDLMLVPNISFSYNGIPPKEFWDCKSSWRWSMLWLSAVPALCLLVYVNRFLIACTGHWLFTRQGIVWIGHWLFPGQGIGCIDNWTFHWHLPIMYAATSASLIWTLYVFTGVVTDRKLGQLIGTCYVFTLVSLTLSVAPFLFPSQLISNPGAEIALLKGCATGSDANIATQVKCAEPPTVLLAQWVVNIGGLATEYKAAPQATFDPTSDPAAPHHGPVELYAISGGLVVPLYVIVLALIGSAVSMTRRVPEYQRSAMSVTDSMSNSEAREKLVFQIMQVVSAPLIAVTAFAIVKPASLTEAVVVGFGSGFASEPILLMIRSLVEKISPTQSDGVVAVKITPALSTPKPGGPIAFTAKVTGSPTNAVTWQIDPVDAETCGTINSAGLYTAPDVVVAAHEITVTAISATDRNKSGTAVIKLLPPTADAVSAPPAIEVATPPVQVPMKPGQTQRFTAPGVPAATVTWTLDPAEPASGTLSDGNYTAPAAVPPNATVQVIANVDGQSVGSATVKIAS